MIKESVRSLVKANVSHDKVTKWSESKLSNKTTGKKVFSELEKVINLANDDPLKEVIIRKHSAIFGRFDSRRKPGRKLSLHEVAVNEAASQVCLIDSSYLVRRDELFMLSRQALKKINFTSKTVKKTSRVSKPKSRLSVVNNIMTAPSTNAYRTSHEDINNHSQNCSIGNQSYSSFQNANTESRNLSETCSVGQYSETLAESVLKNQAESVEAFQRPFIASMLNSMFMPNFQPVSMSNLMNHIWPVTSSQLAPQAAYVLDTSAPLDGPNVTVPKLEPHSPSCD